MANNVFKYVKNRFENGCSNINLFKTRILTSREITTGSFEISFKIS